jgi:phosphoglycolate phosphatase-like HAD superfamily hydrolase
MRAVLLAETALADTDRLFADGVAHLARKLGRVKPLDAAAVPHARAAALAYLADWADGDVSTWEQELARFYEEHIPVYLRPSQTLNSIIRGLAADGVLVGAWSAGPAEAFAVITHHLGLARHLAAVRIDDSPRAPLALSAELGVEAVATVAVTADPAAASAARSVGMLVEPSADALVRLLEPRAG